MVLDLESKLESGLLVTSHTYIHACIGILHQNNVAKHQKERNKDSRIFNFWKQDE